MAELLRETPIINFITSPNKLTRRNKYNYNHKNMISRYKVDPRDPKLKKVLIRQQGGAAIKVEVENPHYILVIFLISMSSTRHGMTRPISTTRIHTKK